MTLTIIPVGFFDSDEAVLSPQQELGQKRLKIPVYAYLIRDAQSLILFDTGCSHRCRTDPIGLLGADTVPYLTPQLAPEDHITAQLARLNLRPDDIDLVVNSHCHFDHAGGNESFEHAEFAMQRAEFESAQMDTEAYPDKAFRPAPTARLTLFENDTQITQGATLLFTPGHTPGHQSLLVELSQQSILITSDAVYTRDHFSPDNVGASHDLDQARASVSRLISVVKDGARPFFSHDFSQLAREHWELAPYSYS